MDMCAAYVRSTREHVKDADAKICFDRLHVAKLLNDAVNAVRKQESAMLSTRCRTSPRARPWPRAPRAPTELPGALLGVRTRRSTPLTAARCRFP
jgi:transposase